MMSARCIASALLLGALLVVPTESFSSLTRIRIESPMMQRATDRTVAFLKTGRTDEANNGDRSPIRLQFHNNSCAEALYYQEDNEELETSDMNKAEEYNPPKRKGYQRAEEWDAEQKAGGLTWDQKVQFDGLRHGNGFRQNQILQKHLGSF